MKAEIIYASLEEEFFYFEDDMPVSEGNIVGVEVETDSEFVLVLAEGIYFCQNES